MDEVQLEERVERSTKRQKLKIGDRDIWYYTLSEAAGIASVPRATFYRWLSTGKLEKFAKEYKIEEGVRQDIFSHHFYISEELLEMLKPENKIPRINQ